MYVYIHTYLHTYTATPRGPVAVACHTAPQEHTGHVHMYVYMYMYTHK
jgi:hypothetical protein